ncbi:unnamed protein product [Spodoptera littoralis]|uniref:Uncharacterized protein n=1 Tax=Spodoptera littoralis TaxID=7109 RepID=A0A9P0IF83_SPOLI|nr:unnamed protein product [Spodoptera littoralis]CAH1646515.1 unnamed protein product [Spodoptera littoralis]
MPNFNLIGLKTDKGSYKLSSPILPTWGWKLSKSFHSGCLRHNIYLHAKFQPDRFKTDNVSYKLSSPILPPIGLKLTKSHTNFHPLFYPLGGGNYQNPFLANAYVITSICMPNYSPICPAVWAVR